MEEGLSHWSNMVLRKSQTYFYDQHTHPNSMYSIFGHVLKANLIFSLLIQFNLLPLNQNSRKINPVPSNLP